MTATHRVPSVASMLLAALALGIFCGSVRAQHDIHRNAMRMIANGDQQWDKAVAGLEKQPDDPESHYLQALLDCLRNNPQQAVEHAKAALDAGLPLERFLAGPRDAMAPLYATEQFQAWAKQRDAKLLHGPMLGSATDTSARVWGRTADASDLSVKVWPAEGDSGDAKQTPEVRTSAEHDYTAVVEISGLEPEVSYRYQLLVDGRPVGKVGLLKTYPKEGSASRFKVAFGGGAGFVPEHEPMWNTVAARDPLAVLMLGDNVYIDDPTHAWTQKYCYYRRQSRPEWRELVANRGVYAIYDDHDFGTDDCVPGPHIEKPAWKREVWELFCNNWNNPSYGGGPAQPGCWFDFHIGDVHFILIDGRYYRDPRSGSMLGPVQKAWLLETLKNSRGTFKVLASNVPWCPGIKPGSRDPWDGYPEEREEIFDFLAQNKIDGVLLIAADRHRTDLRWIERDEGYDLIEFQSSRLTNHHTHKIVKTPGLVHGYNKTCSFGLMKFDTTAADPVVALETVAIDGRTIHSMELRKSQISH